MTSRSIRTEEDYELALAEIEAYVDQESPLGSPESKRFRALAGQIAAYEAEHWPIETADPPIA